MKRLGRIHIPPQTMRVNVTAKKRDTVAATKLLRTVAFSSTILLALLSFQTAIALDEVDPLDPGGSRRRKLHNGSDEESWRCLAFTPLAVTSD